MADHIYLGSAKKKEFPNGGHVIAVALTMDDLEKHFREYGYISKGGKRILNLNISTRREVSQYGETHTVEVNTWKPDSASLKSDGGQNHQERVDTKNIPPDFPDDIPF